MKLDLTPAWHRVLDHACSEAATAVTDYCQANGLALLTAVEIRGLIERAAAEQPWLCPACGERTGQLVAAAESGKRTCQACYLAGWKKGER